MFSRFLWRPIAGAVLVALPALALFPGCGGGGSDSGSGQVTRLTGVNLLNGKTLLTQGNLSLTFNRSNLSSQSVVGYLQIIGGAPTPTATTTATPLATTVVALNKGRQTTALPGSYTPLAANYQVQGTVSLSSSTAAPVVSLTGAFSPQRPFTITGTFTPAQTLILTSDFVLTGTPTQSGTLDMLVLDGPITASSTATPVATVTVTGTPGATTATTPIPSASATATQIGSATATPFATATSTPVA